MVTYQFGCQVKVWGLEMLNRIAVKSKILEDVRLGISFRTTI